MKKENIKVELKDMELVDGKVVINSEELAAAIQDCELDPNAPEENEAVFIGLGCRVNGGN